MASEATLDALPYYDRELDHALPAVRQRIEREIEAEFRKMESRPSSSLSEEERAQLEHDVQEAKRVAHNRPKGLSTPSHPSLQPLPDLFAGRQLLQTALERVASSSGSLQPPSDGLNLAKYNVPQISSIDANQAESALNQSRALLEHQAIRAGNVELLQKYGANSWRIRNFLLEQDLARIEREVEGMSGLTEDLNRRRKLEQTAAGAQLTSLEAKWTALISGNIQLGVACVSAEHELVELRERERILTEQLQA